MNLATGKTICKSVALSLVYPCVSHFLGIGVPKACDKPRSLGTRDRKVLSSDGFGGAADPAKFGGFNATHQRSRMDPSLGCSESGVLRTTLCGKKSKRSKSKIKINKYVHKCNRKSEKNRPGKIGETEHDKTLGSSVTMGTCRRL